MKKHLVSMSLLLAILLSGCGDGQPDSGMPAGTDVPRQTESAAESETNKPTVPESVTESPSETESETEVETEAETEAETESETEAETEPAEEPVEEGTGRRSIKTRKADSFLMYTPSDNVTQDAYNASFSGMNVLVYTAADASDGTMKTIENIAKTILSLKGSRFEVPTVTVCVKDKATLDGIAASIERFADAWYKQNGKPVVFVEGDFTDDRYAVQKLSSVTPHPMTDVMQESVIRRAYETNGWNGIAPTQPVSWGLFDNFIKLTYYGYPTEYMISDKADFSNAAWQILNVATGVPYGELLETTRTVYVKTRNLFGESPATAFEVTNTEQIFHEGATGVLYEENFSNLTIDDMAQNWEFRPSDTRSMGSSGGISTNGELVLRWVNGRSARLKTLLTKYTLSLDFHPEAQSTKLKGNKASVAIRQPVEAINPIYEEYFDKHDNVTSVGAFGIYISCYNDQDQAPDIAPVLEIMIHDVDRASPQGASAKIAYIDLPKEIDFKEYHKMTVDDAGTTIKISVDDVHYATIELSGIGKSANRTYKYDGEVYKKAKVYDAAGNLLLEVDKAEVLAEGYLLFTNRGNACFVDNIVIAVKEEEAQG